MSIPVNASSSDILQPGIHIFSFIRDHYGQDAIRHARCWEKAASREAITFQQLQFLHTCLRTNVMPRSVRYSPPVKSNVGKQVAMENSRRMVKVLITDCHQRLRRFQDRVRQAVDKLTPMIDAPAIFQLRGAIRSLSGADAAEKRRSLDKKMSRLMSSTSHPAPEVHNLSSKQLSANQMRALDRGMKFNLSDASPLDFVASLDSVLERARVPDDDRHLIRQQISTLIINHPRRPIIPPAEKKAIEELKADESIVILPADKGRSTVVIDKQAYVEKAAALLNDEETYEPVEGDPMKKLASRTQKKLMSLKSSGAITKKEYHWIKPSDAPLARFYCLPKVHKEGVPLRPIVALRGSPMYNLSVWLARLLRPLTLHSETTVPSPKQFSTAFVESG